MVQSWLKEAIGEHGKDWPEETWKKIEKACALRKERALEAMPIWGNLRESDEVSLVHLLSRLHLGPDAICAGLLVDPLGQELITEEEISKALNKQIAQLCRKVCHLPAFSFASSTVKKEKNRQREQVQLQAESFRRMLLAMAQDLRVVLVLLAIRLHQLRFLGFIPVQEQMAIARECREISAPLANRMGISWLKNELEDLSLRYLYPQDYYKLASRLASTRNERNQYIQDVQVSLQELVHGQGIKAEVAGRPKHINSIYRKLKRNSISFEQLFDITAFRVVCQNKEQCYQILGLIHARWTPVPGRFKDYIALPKSNRYQSLHTTVIGPHNKPMEVQIRTEEMHSVAEDGIAAHWLYKEGGKSTRNEDVVQWLRSLLHLQDEKSDAQEFIADLKDHLFDEKVFAFTPKGDVKEMMRGATPLDFAYAIHSEVGHRCVGAKVNGKMVPLRYELKNGDMVEIMTSPSGQPNQGQLEVAVTGRALTKIRSFLRTTQRQQATVLGRTLLEKELPSNHRSLSKLTKSGALLEVAQEMGWGSIDELLMQIGYGKIDVKAVVEALFPSEKPVVEEVIDLREEAPKPKKSSGGILVGGMSDILVHTARCCNPIPGDPIVGFISRGRGAIIHTANCSKVHELDPQRQIEVSWSNQQNATHTVTLRIITENRTGLLTQISRVFSDRNINITSARCQTFRDEAVNIFQCHVSDVQQLDQLSLQLTRIRGVHRVERLRR